MSERKTVDAETGGLPRVAPQGSAPRGPLLGASLPSAFRDVLEQRTPGLDVTETTLRCAALSSAAGVARVSGDEMMSGLRSPERRDWWALTTMSRRLRVDTYVRNIRQRHVSVLTARFLPTFRASILFAEALYQFAVLGKTPNIVRAELKAEMRYRRSLRAYVRYSSLADDEQLRSALTEDLDCLQRIVGALGRPPDTSGHRFTPAQFSVLNRLVTDPTNRRLSHPQRGRPDWPRIAKLFYSQTGRKAEPKALAQMYSSKLRSAGNKAAIAQQNKALRSARQAIRAAHRAKLVALGVQPSEGPSLVRSESALLSLAARGLSKWSLSEQDSLRRLASNPEYRHQAGRYKGQRDVTKIWEAFNLECGSNRSRRAVDIMISRLTDSPTEGEENGRGRKETESGN